MSRSSIALALTWLAYGVLLAQQSLDAILRDAPGVIWAFKLVPLLVFLPGMWRARPRSFIWLCFVSLGYFAILVQRIFAEPGSALVIVGLTAVVVLFIAAMLFVRWHIKDAADSAE